MEISHPNFQPRRSLADLTLQQFRRIPVWATAGTGRTGRLRSQQNLGKNHGDKLEDI